MAPECMKRWSLRCRPSDERLVPNRFRISGVGGWVVVTFHLVGVLDRPSEALDQLRRKMLAFEVRHSDPLPVRHGAFPESSLAIRGHDDLRPPSLLLAV